MMKERNEQTLYRGITVSHALVPKVCLIIATARLSAIQTTTTSIRVLVTDVINKQPLPIHK
jgi:hypothetical protein